MPRSVQKGCAGGGRSRWRAAPGAPPTASPVFDTRPATTISFAKCCSSATPLPTRFPHRRTDEPTRAMTTAPQIIEDFVNTVYEYGFVTDIESESAPPGLNEDIIRLISQRKKGHHES